MYKIDGKRIAEEWLTTFSDKLTGRKLVVFLVGENQASELYVKMKQKKAEEFGVEIEVVKTESNLEKIKTEIRVRQSEFDGVMVQLPLPNELQAFKQEILDLIDPVKDVDCLTSSSLGRVMTAGQVMLPATVAGILHLLEIQETVLKGKHVVLVGASTLIGKPLAMVLEASGATVTLCNEFTANLAKVTNLADILISATGVPYLLSAQHVKEGAIVIDVGTGFVDNKLTGDVDFVNVAPKASWITPVPGGIGPLTIAGLLYNLSLATMKR